MARVWIIWWLLSAPGLVAASETVQIEVVGLFKNAAVLNINGEQQLLKIGQRSLEGVLLLSADSRGASIAVDGETLQLDLSSYISAEFTDHVPTTVAIRRANNQYHTTGSINGVPVSFLIDTGATILAMNSRHAVALGLDMSRAKLMQARTASGAVDSRQVMIKRVDVGDIQVNNVLAAVLPGDYPAEILLGMSFLRNVKMSENAGLMLLKSR